jgi:hypothetical protein
MTVRLTENCSTSDASVGSFSPTASRPARISAASTSATWSESWAPGVMELKRTTMGEKLIVQL